MASGCVAVSGGRREGPGRRSSKVYIIRFIADLPQGGIWVAWSLAYGTIIETLLFPKQ